MKTFLVVIALIIIGCFNVIFFLLNDTENSTSTWIIYSFINIALLSPVVIGLLKFRKSDMSASATLISGIYCIVELFVGIIFFLINPENWIWPFIIQFVLLCIAAVLVLSYLAIDKK